MSLLDIVWAIFGGGIVLFLGLFAFVALLKLIYFTLVPLSKLALQPWHRWKFRAEIAAEEYASEGNYTAAISLLEEKRHLEGPSALLLNNLATYLDAAGEHVEAVRALEEAERLFGMQYIIQLNKVLFLTHAGRTQDALALLHEMMLTSKPDNFDLVYRYAVILWRMNQRDQAAQQYYRAEAIFFREKSEDLKKEWLPFLDKLRVVLERQTAPRGKTGVVSPVEHITE